MAEKTIKLFATLRDIAGAKEITVPLENGMTARDLVRAVTAAHPELGSKILNEDGELSGLVHIFVDGRNIEWLNGLDTVISEDTDLVLIPPVAGG